ncbi:MAG: FecR domain-containing protein [Cyclobacteriaceae bacterium]
MSKKNDHTDLLARWLSNDLTKEEKKHFDENPEFNDLKAVVEDIDSWKIPPLDLDAGFSELQSKKEETNSTAKMISMTTWFRVAASIALIAVTYVGWDYFLNNEVLIQTTIGEKQEVELPDGSKVNLDVSSSLSYAKRNWLKNREVEIFGQAFLDVKSGGSFVVQTNSGTVSVLGTRFNVNISTDAFEVRCYEGKVLVESGEQNVTLLANEGTELLNSQLNKYLIKEQLDWMSGFNSYSQAPLSEVVLDLQKYYPIEINLPDRFTDMRFTGRFSHTDEASALRSVFATMEIRYSVLNGIVVFE